MKLTYIGMLFLCIVMLSIGQILFKLAAMRLRADKDLLGLVLSFFTWPMIVALTVYAGATFLWVYLLRDHALNRVYPAVALTFVIVPAMSTWFFNEPMGSNYLLGLCLILIGLFFITT